MKINLSWLAVLAIFASFAIVAFGQAAWIPALAPIAAVCGYALFWKGIQNVVSSKKRFWLSTLWYAAVQAIQTSWMTDYQFQGLYILGVYTSVIFLLGLQFGLLTHWVFKIQKNLLNSLALAGFWVILEWGRLYLFCGFPWNPAGMALASSSLSIQLASLLGVYGLSFWVLWTNLLFHSRKWVLACIALFFPYFFGWVIQSQVEHKDSLTVALVDTDFLPSEKMPFQEALHSYIPPSGQWEHMWGALKAGMDGQKVDLIVFPEAAIPYLANKNMYPYEWVVGRLSAYFGSGIEKSFPNSDLNKVSNLWISQALANYFNAEVVIGFDDREEGNYYQAAFHLTPQGKKSARYEKKILVPLAEYLPMKALKNLTKYYGIQEFYTPGPSAKIFQSKIPFSISICYEEVFGGYVRQGRQKGGELFVNLTNDNWFPNSKLGKQHFEHARLRAVENGVPLIRCCNWGLSGGFDCLGNQVIFKESRKAKSALLVAPVPLTHLKTLYTQLGDYGIVFVSIFFIAIALISHGRTFKILEGKEEIS